MWDFQAHNLNFVYFSTFYERKTLLKSASERFLELEFGNMCAESKLWAEQWSTGGWPLSIHGVSAEFLEESREPGAEEGLWQPAEVKRQPAATVCHVGSTETPRPRKWGAVPSAQARQPSRRDWKISLLPIMLKKFSSCFAEACLLKSHLISKSYYTQICFWKLRM